MPEPHTFTLEQIRILFPNDTDEELQETLEEFNWRPEAL